MSGRLPLNLELRRRDEDRRQAVQAGIDEQRRVAGRVDFQHRTDKAIKSLLVRQEIAKKNAQLKAQIEQRRARLAALLETEKQQYEREIEATFESPEAAKARILSYARKLKEENEAARRKLVEDLEERRFRQGSDVLRARQSKIMAERVALDRVAQLQEKAVREEQKYVQQAAESAMLDDEARAVSAMRAAELEARKRLEAEMRTVLDQQVQVKRELQAKDAHFDSRSVQAMLEADKAAAEAQRREADQRRSSAREEYERTQVFNATWKDVKDRAAKAEYEADKADLDNALARAAAEAQAEREAAAARRRDALAFKQRLEEQMSLQAEDKGWLERFYAEEGEKEWSKRQAKWDAEAQARKGLMDDVARTRLQQMEDKKMRAAMEGKDDAAQLQYFAQLQARADEEERQRQAKRQQQQLLAFEMARRQMEENERARAANKQQEYLEWRSQQKFEREYQARVDRLLQEGGPGLGGTAGGTQQGMGVTGVSMGMASTRR